jgi:hypothetical protein
LPDEDIEGVPLKREEVMNASVQVAGPVMVKVSVDAAVPEMVKACFAPLA